MSTGPSSAEQLRIIGLFNAACLELIQKHDHRTTVVIPFRPEALLGTLSCTEARSGSSFVQKFASLTDLRGAIDLADGAGEVKWINGGYEFEIRLGKAQSDALRGMHQEYKQALLIARSYLQAVHVLGDK